MGYELWDRGNLTLVPKKPGDIQHEYLREALKNGLKVEQDLGTNPFKYGMAGAAPIRTMALWLRRRTTSLPSS